MALSKKHSLCSLLLTTLQYDMLLFNNYFMVHILITKLFTFVLPALFLIIYKKNLWDPLTQKFYPTILPSRLALLNEMTFKMWRNFYICVWVSLTRTIHSSIVCILAKQPLLWCVEHFQRFLKLTPGVDEYVKPFNSIIRLPFWDVTNLAET